MKQLAAEAYPLRNYSKIFFTIWYLYAYYKKKGNFRKFLEKVLEDFKKVQIGPKPQKKRLKSLQNL